ncbi:MAG: hypothetical protein COZ06_33005 [Armatimonadetes bacterium CG_4_10_14_3_um_filter_66_18]|nr:MAG: hypothetical protein COZ06_33005 [Armatimonadetes bacterium CG_4_10_14_3_um_filter_66_18]PIZ35099.1 MAG: hypothetical protein COY42_27410 [Armatimonadetes bacterium CG_4_10_14_0_8_um_filter_66_14]
MRNAKRRNAARGRSAGAGAKSCWAAIHWLVEVCLLTTVWACRAEAEQVTGIASIQAFPQKLVVNLTGSAKPARLVELRPYQTDPSAQSARSDLSVSTTSQRRLDLPRFAGQRDRLYSKFQLVDAATEHPLGAPHYVDDLSGLPAWKFDMPWPKSKKGVTCPVDLDDLKALGVKYVDTNVILNGLLDWRSENPAESWEVDGQKVGINLDYVRQFDRQIKQMNDAGINVTLIILNGVPTAPDPANPLIHPRTDLAGAPNHLGAINVNDERGLRYFRAAMEYLAHRYSDPDGAHGWVSGYIIGNELQAHWVWHNTGLIAADDLARDYATQLRIAWLAVRRYHSKVRVYASMDHHWTARFGSDPLKSVRGDKLLEQLNAVTKAEGDFPWNVAFHPYPEHLGNPKFWEDKTAVLGFDTQRITFKNLEVLPAFLHQEPFLCYGQPRRIILSEQGLHCPDGPDGEEIQAAAYARAYYKVSHLPDIDAFILHRHVDHRDEGGLHLGLWTCKQDGPNPGVPDRKRLIWDVFRLADTDQWEQAFAFAKPIIGIKDWNEALPSAGPIPADSGVFAAPLDPRSVVYDLIDNMGKAQVTTCLDWRVSTAKGADGRLYPTLFQHPPAKDGTLGTATFALELPKLPAGRRLELQFGTVLTAPSSDGVEFAVLVDGKEAWAEKQTAAEQPTAHTLDLSANAGQTIQLTLRVDSLKDAGNDWANWLRPAVVLTETKTAG